MNGDGAISRLISAFFYRGNTQAIGNVNCVCWIDGEQFRREAVPTSGGSLNWMLDVSQLSDGLHQIDVQALSDDGVVSRPVSAFFYKESTQTVGNVSCVCWIDGEQFRREAIPASGGSLNWILDVAQLPDGLHQIDVQAISDDGAVSRPVSSFFYKGEGQIQTANMSIDYEIDGSIHNQLVANINDGLYHFDVDVEQLEPGLHRLTCFLTDDNGLVSTVQRYFVKIPQDGYGVSHYEYWLNDSINQSVNVDLPSLADPFKLITLLPFESWPIRSKDFQFVVDNGTPLLYARNDMHIRFYDASDNVIGVSGKFVDQSVKEYLTDVTLLSPGETKTAARPENNEILWYKVEVARGDSLSFKADRACTIQVFSPDGEELKQVYGSGSVTWNGLHAPKDGTYYVAQHDMTASQGNTLDISYQHIDKYAILDYDVHTVGNGGASTITINGNGFDDLYAVDLINTMNDSIHHVVLTHRHNSDISTTFDFMDAPIGQYDAIFYFVEENKIIENFLSVEQAKDIELELSVSYPNTYRKGTSVTYTINITNKGNMTAYAVPIKTIIENPTISGISYIEYDGIGFDIEDEINESAIDGLSEEDINDIIQSLKELGHDIYFRKAWDVKDETSSDSVLTRMSYVLLNIAPYSTRTLSLTIKSDDEVNVQVLLPSEWFAVSDKPNKDNKLRDGASDICCITETYTCFVDLGIKYLDGLSAILGTTGLLIPITSETLEPASLAAGIISCVATAGNGMLKEFSETFCQSDKTGIERFMNAVAASAKSVLSLGPLLSCAGAVLTKVVKNVVKVLKNIATGVGVMADAYSVKQNDATWKKCVSTFKTHCPPPPPPLPPGGGSSTPVIPVDPNEMIGYVAPSGSKYIGENVKEIDYTICFENDTSATAPASTVILTDTIDRSLFDLDSFAPSQIKIGDRIELLDGSPNFIRTMDLRPDVDCIAQIECSYDRSKGIATWMLSSLDPMTMEPITDYTQGLLPVNLDGRGQGEVSYRISLKNNLIDGTEVKARAAIKFDDEDVIMTPDWVNIIDGVEPTSRVIGCELLNDSVAAVSIRGEDDRSGPWQYDIYAQYGGGEWVTAASEVPIDRAAQVRVYEGIEHHFYALLTDSAGNVEVKEPLRELTFDYFSSDTETNLTLNLAKGWNWISHNLNSPLSVDVLKPNAYRIMGHDGETINDPRYGYTGTVSQMSPTELYKVEMSTADNIQLSGKLFNSALKPVPLVAGWNWIGYPMPGVMSVNEALVLLEADEDDCIVGQDGTAVYNDGLWRGTLTTLEPGKGYLLKTSSDKPLRLNNSRSSVRLYAPAMESQDDSEIWSVDIHRYPNVTPIIADLWDGYTLTSSVGYGLAAFVGDECRGIATEVNGRWMMNVYGIGGEKVTFKALDRSTGLVHDVTEIEAFTADLLGTMALPVQLHIADGSGLNNVMFDDVDVTPTLTTGPVTVTASAAIDEVMVINMAGMTVMGYSNIPSGFTLDLGSEPDGVYLIQVHTGSHISYFIAIVAVMLMTVTAKAASHWTCDSYAFQYDMTAYVQLTDGGFPLQDYSDYEIAAFVGDECRGIAQIVEATKPYGLIRIRSNEVNGEHVYFKVYRFSTYEEITIYDVGIEFVSQGIDGLPSAPLYLELTHQFLVGDTNGDGEVNIADLNALIDAVLGNDYGREFDVNGDGEVNIADVNALIDIILAK